MCEVHARQGEEVLYTHEWEVAGQDWKEVAVRTMAVCRYVGAGDAKKIIRAAVEYQAPRATRSLRVL